MNPLPWALQWLNVGIFQAIGHPGVYYGFKLGHTIPWASGFPFNVVSHPQYVGSVASILGAAVLVRLGVGGGVRLVCWGCWLGGRLVAGAGVGVGGQAEAEAAAGKGLPSSWGRCRGPGNTFMFRQEITRVPLAQVWSQAPAGLGLLVCYWTLLYVATAFQEDKLHVD